jgi:hypothetical protein
VSAGAERGIGDGGQATAELLSLRQQTATGAVAAPPHNAEIGACALIQRLSIQREDWPGRVEVIASSICRAHPVCSSHTRLHGRDKPVPWLYSTRRRLLLMRLEDVLVLVLSR